MKVPERSPTSTPTTWSCQLEMKEKFTVGTEGHLICSGSNPVALNAEKVKIQFPKQDQIFTLHVLRTEKASENQVDLVVTGYKPGEYKDVTFVLTDGEKQIPVHSMSYTVESVIPQDQQAQPFGPFGPFTLSIPLWVWILLAIAVSAVLGWSIYAFRRWQRRRKQFAEVPQFASALTPYNQFAKDLRAFRKKPTDKAEESFKDLESIFRFFLLRQYEIPAHLWKSGEIVTELKQKKKIKKENNLTELKKIFREFDRISSGVESSKNQLQDSDREQILKMCMQFADRVGVDHRELS